MGRIRSRKAGEYGMTERCFFTSGQLKLIAITAMLIDHLGVTLFPGAVWMRCVGRIAFPLFAFELVEGYIHTHDLRRYAGRLLLLAAVSEIPFNMVVGASLLCPGQQNAVWTLLAGLAACYCVDGLSWRRGMLGRLVYLTGLIVSLLLPGVLMSDYGTEGVMLVLLFLLTRGRDALGAVFQAAVMLVMWWLFSGGETITAGPFGLGVQCFALLSLPLIWLYNGRRGGRGRELQFAAYAFYPAHLLILGMLMAGGVTLAL